MASPDEDPWRRRDEPPPLEFRRPDEGTPAAAPPERPAAWVTRPEDYGLPPAPVPRERPRFGRSGVAGIFLILTALIGVALTWVLLTTPLTPEEEQLVANMTAEERAANLMLTLIVLYSQPAALLGGVMALQKKNWKLAVVCSVFALASFFVFVVAGFLSVAALLLILTARQEFTS